MKGFGTLWVIAYGIYQDLEDHKLLTPGGGILGLDIKALNIYFDWCNYDNLTRRNLWRKVRMISHVIADQENEWVRSRSGNASASHSTPLFKKPRFR